MTKQAAAEKQTPVFDQPISTIRESATNPRTFFDLVALKELAESIKSNGLIQPVVIRPRPGVNAGPESYELVIGARRLRASKLAGCSTIRAIIAPLSDAEAIEWQIVENLQREGVHQLEEAQSYHRLMQPPHNKTVAELAVRAGKSKTYILQVLKLRSLSKAAKEAFLRGAIEFSVAVLIARVADESAQDRILQEVAANEHNAPMPYKHARDLIERDFLLRLDKAPFDRASLTLYPQAGACSACPKRTGNQRELFGEVTSPELCTDPVCFKEKTDAAWRAAAAAAEKAGKKVLSDEEAKQVFPHGEYVSSKAAFMSLDDPCYEDPKQRTYREVLGKRAAVTTVLARDGAGATRELASRTEVKAALAAAGVAKPQAQAGEKERRADAEHHRAAVRASIAACVAAAQPGPEYFRIMIRHIARSMWSDTIVEVEKRRGLESRRGADRGAALVKLAEGLPLAELGPLMLEIVITQGAYHAYHQSMGSGLKDAAKAFGVDLKAIARQVAADAKAAERAAKPDKKGRRS